MSGSLKVRSYSALASSSDQSSPLRKMPWQISHSKFSRSAIEHLLEGLDLLFDGVGVVLPVLHRVDDPGRHEEALVDVVGAVPVACSVQDAVTLADAADVHRLAPSVSAKASASAIS